MSHHQHGRVDNYFPLSRHEVIALRRRMRASVVLAYRDDLHHADEGVLQARHRWVDQILTAVWTGTASKSVSAVSLKECYQYMWGVRRAINDRTRMLYMLQVVLEAEGRTVPVVGTAGFYEHAAESSLHLVDLECHRIGIPRLEAMYQDRQHRGC